MKIGFANEIANVCEKVGADATEVMTSIGLDSRIGRPFLNAGLGWGGSCFGKDIQSLLHTAQEYGYQARLLEASLAVNYTQRLIAIQKLQEKLLILKGRTIALLGLAFKPDTDDLRDAPSLQIAGRLLQLGARVKAYDPIAVPACRAQNPAENSILRFPFRHRLPGRCRRARHRMGRVRPARPSPNGPLHESAHPDRRPQLLRPRDRTPRRLRLHRYRSLHPRATAPVASSRH
jgi:hypothetical protein